MNNIPPLVENALESEDVRENVINFGDFARAAQGQWIEQQCTECRAFFQTGICQVPAVAKCPITCQPGAVLGFQLEQGTF